MERRRRSENITERPCINYLVLKSCFAAMALTATLAYECVVQALLERARSCESRLGAIGEKFHGRNSTMPRHGSLNARACRLRTTSRANGIVAKK